MTIASTFYGAARTETGSKHLLAADGMRILVDCGQFQGLKELRQRNWTPPPFDPAHADRHELVRWSGAGARPPKSIFLAHGEPRAATIFSGDLRAAGRQVAIPGPGQRFVFEPATGARRQDGRA